MRSHLHSPQTNKMKKLQVLSIIFLFTLALPAQVKDLVHYVNTL